MATLYRYYDHNGRLLYVGRTAMGKARGSAHARSAVWWKYVAFAEFYEVSATGIALAERLAIWSEPPAFNTQGRLSTGRRQEMLARIALWEAQYPGCLLRVRDTSEITGLPDHDIHAAVRWGFIESDYPRAAHIAPDALRRFIGEADSDHPNGKEPGIVFEDLRPYYRRVLRGETNA